MTVRRQFVLGGTGFLGRHVALALLRRSEHVTIAARSPLIDVPQDVDVKLLSFLPCDLATADWDSILRDGDVVHHFACSTIPKTANDDPLGDLDVNLRGTLRLLEVLRKRQGMRLLFSSSGGTVYGRTQQTPIPESHALNPITAYGASKVAIEKYVGYYRDRYGLDARISRLSNPFGAGQDPSGKQGAASIFLRLALSGQPIQIWGDGSVVRDYIHIADAVAGLLALADASPESLGPHSVFNLGTGVGISVAQILAFLEERLGHGLNVSYLPERTFDVATNILDIGLARRVLGWSPKRDFNAGMNLAIRDFAEGPSRYSTLL